MQVTPERRAHHGPFMPQLGVDWEPRGRTFRENLRTFFRRLPHARGTLAPAYFRQLLGGVHFPMRAVLVSAFAHFLFVQVQFPGWPEAKAETAAAASTHVQLTYYGPIRDFPRMRPPGPRKRPVPPEEPKPARRGADAFHPRQTIVSMPKQPNHPRQTLIQPAAPQAPPKILPQLPNIVQWSEAPQPARPRLRVRAPVMGKARSRIATIPAADLPIPAVPNLEKNLGELNIASSAPVNPRPQLGIKPMSVPKAGPRQEAGSAEPAPEIGPNVSGGSGVQNLVALSAAPAPPAPVEIPPGNLQARIVISPEGAQPGTPPSAGTNGGSNATPVTGPPGISISGGSTKDSSNISGLSPGTSARAMPGTPLPPKPEPRLAPAAPTRTRPPAPGLERIQPGAPPEEILGPKRIYTVHLNRPNLSSSTGSWVLRFAELRDSDAANGSGGDGQHLPDLSTPVPIRQVDPKYPPALADARVEGEVVLYAIIRKDGTVDSIQVVRSVEPQLDRNAMDALARWKFRPSERAGAPVDVEAVVHIPFRALGRTF
jgi:protein TonB